jgi:hypothetical protein
MVQEVDVSDPGNSTGGAFVDYVRAWLGSRRKPDPIREGLFASQSLHEWAGSEPAAAKSGPWQRLAEAARLIEAGRKTEAVAVLREVLLLRPLDTRHELLLWTALRELGERPDRLAAYEVLGVVLEIPVEQSYDTLAAYADGSARYLNFSGKMIFWDAADRVVKGLCQGLLDSTIPSGAQAKPRTGLGLPKRGSQATLLTRSGNYVIADAAPAIQNAGAALMLELVRRARENPS